MATALNLGNANGKTITLRNPDTNNSDITVEMDKVVVKDSNGQSTLGSIKLVGETKSHILSTDTDVGGTNAFRIARYSNSGVFEAVPFNINSAGNVGIGVIPSAWGSSLKALDIGYGTAVANMASYVSSVFAANCYYNGGWKYKNNEVASVYESNGTHMWKTAPSGTAGNAITWTQVMTLDASGNLLLTSGTGGLGYGTGAGGTVTQATSKATAVTLNKPTGIITMNNAALAAGASVEFTLNNSLLSTTDLLVLAGSTYSYNYTLNAKTVSGNAATIRVTNVTAGNLSETLDIKFAIIKGANA